jgi:hypothetical protein
VDEFIDGEFEWTLGWWVGVGVLFVRKKTTVWKKSSFTHQFWNF